jgi:hypothetical protein
MAGRPQIRQRHKDIRRAPSCPKSQWFVWLCCCIDQDESILFKNY